MQFVVLNDARQTEYFGTAYAQPDFMGESQKLTLGSYRREQLALNNIGSIRMQADCTCILYENADGTGKSAATDGEIEDFSGLGFVPQAFLLLPHVSCYRDGQLRQRFFIGRYAPALLLEYDRIRVPKASAVVFEGVERDGKVFSVSNGEFEVADLPKDAKSLVVSVEGVLKKEPEGELSYEQLMQVAAGAEEAMDSPNVGGSMCMVDACAAHACAIDSCAVQGCPANACVTNVIPVVGLI